jgi:internalin A
MHNSPKKKFLNSVTLEERQVLIDLTNSQIQWDANSKKNHIVYLKLERINGDIPTSFQKLTFLQNLEMDFCHIPSKPMIISHFSMLKSIKISDSLFDGGLEFGEDLYSLKVLRLEFNHLSILPESIKNLNALTELAISFNPLNSLPEWLGNYSNLQTLEIQELNLTQIPSWVKRLTNLQTLIICGNPIASLEPIQNLPLSLKSLFANFMELTEIPSAISELTNLEELILGTNHITSLPDSIGQLTNLKQIDLVGNDFTIYPKILSKMPRLKTIDITQNPLPNQNNSTRNGLRKFVRKINALFFKINLCLTQKKRRHRRNLAK